MKKILSLFLCLLLCTGCAQIQAPDAAEPTPSTPAESTDTYDTKAPEAIAFEDALPAGHLDDLPPYYVNCYMDNGQLIVFTHDPLERDMELMKTLPGGADAIYINIDYNIADLKALQENLHRSDRTNAIASSIIGASRLEIILSLNRPKEQAVIRDLLTPYFLPDNTELTEQQRRMALPIIFEGDTEAITLSELDAQQTDKHTPEEFPNLAECYMQPLQEAYPVGTTEITARWKIKGSDEWCTGSPYHTEKYIDGEWHAVDSGGSWTMELIGLETGKEMTFRFINAYFDTDGLTAGHYRIVKSVGPDGSQYDTLTYCYFWVK